MKLTIFTFLLIELIAVSYLDFKNKKISNYWSMLNIVLALIFYLTIKSEYIFSWNIFIYPVIMLIAGFFMFAIGIMGAGDAKYLFSFYLLIPFAGHYSFFTSLLIVTIIFALINIFVKAVRANKQIYEEIFLKNYKKIFKILVVGKMPYAPVILGAWVLFALDWVYDIY